MSRVPWTARDLKPMLAKLADGPFDDPQWVFEVKWDGYRLMIEIVHGAVRLISRNGIDVSKKYPEISKAFARMRRNAVIDGELVALDRDGKPDFQLMQNVQREKAVLVFYAFDMLFDGNEDLRDLPLLKRKKRLAKLLPKSAHVRFSKHIAEHGVRYFKAAEKQHLEGIMGKRADSAYLSGKRSDAWLKIKTAKRQEAVVIGYTRPRNSRKYVGSLVLAVREGNAWKYIGHTGGSMGGKSLRDVYDLLQPLRMDKSIAEVPKDVVREHPIWVRPKLLVEVRFTEWTEDGQMRHPVVVGFRDDKEPSHVVREKEARTERTGRFSNLDKVYFPGGYTKGDVIDYYDKIADTILPYLKDRPMVLNRHPDGIDRPSFFQKDTGELHLPDFVQTVMVHSDSNDTDSRYILVNNKETLLYVANLGCIELNPWGSRRGSLDRPDFYIIDIDPGIRPFSEVIEVAKVCREVLARSCEESCVKTSGKKGLHVYVPLRAKYPYDTVRSFSELICRVVNGRLPQLTTLERTPGKRHGKIYLDYLRNGLGQTAAAAYSLRPTPDATVSTPLEWKEVKKGLDPRDFTIRSIFPRLKRKGDLWEPMLGEGVDLRKAIQCLENESGETQPRH